MIPVLQIRIEDIEALTARLDGAASQIPFALSRTLNDGIRKVRDVFIQSTWPSHVTQRNASFMRSQLHMDFSTKTNLTVAIGNVGGPNPPRAHLALHAKGGTKQAKGRLAIPPKGTRVSGHGLRPAARPRAIVANTPARALRITPTGIFVGKHGRLQLKFSLLKSAVQPADVPFLEDFKETMNQTMRTAFPDYMRQAMKSRR